MREGTVATDTPRPRVMRYLGDVATAWLGGFFEWLFGTGDFEQTALEIVRWMIIALSALLLGLLLFQAYRRWRAMHLSAPTAPKVKVETLAPTPAAATDWRHEVETRLEGGDPDAALDALWWWLAERLDIKDADASWTTPELARRAGRRDLLPLVRRWDRLVYGGGAVSVEPVRALWRGFEEALA
ncbi:MAG: hypothetical protein AAGM22_00150 [Acidobacteriota bacterium]